MTQTYRIEQLAEYFRGQHIAIVGNGPSVVRSEDGKRTAPVFDVSQLSDGLIWTVNGGWYYHPNSVLGFQMDDLKGPAMAQHPNADWYTGLAREAKIPIITSKPYPDFPSTVAFPLEDAIRFFRMTYYAESVSYMIQLAIMFGVRRIDLMGVDYQMDPVTKMGVRPQERACTEFWCGVAHAHGIQLAVLTPESSILKATYDWDEGYYMPAFYGYSEDNFPLEWDGSPASMNIHVREKPPGEAWWVEPRELQLLRTGGA